MILNIILAVIATEAVTEILLMGEPFEWLRRLMFRHDFTAGLFSCGWCLSVWVATGLFVLATFLSPVILIPLVIHRLSNVFHDICSWINNKGE